MKCLICNESLYCVSAECVLCHNEGGLTEEFPVTDATDIVLLLKCTKCNIDHKLCINGFTMDAKLTVDKSQDVTLVNKS